MLETISDKVNISWGYNIDNICCGSNMYLKVCVFPPRRFSMNIELSIYVSSDYQVTYPRCSMYGICTYIWASFGVNVGKYSLHGAFGYRKCVKGRVAKPININGCLSLLSPWWGPRIPFLDTCFPTSIYKAHIYIYIYNYIYIYIYNYICKYVYSRFFPMKFPFKSSKPPLIKDIMIFTYIFLWLSHVFPWFFLETSINLRDVPRIFPSGGHCWGPRRWRWGCHLDKKLLKMAISPLVI